MSDALSSPARQRALGAAWFGVWGVLAAGFVWLVPALDRGGVVSAEMFLLVLLPGFAALPVGALVGPWILDPSRAEAWKAVAVGLLAAVLAHLVFALLLALGMWLEVAGNANFWGAWMATTLLGIPMMGTVTLPAGALAGWLLHLLGRTVR